VVASYPEGIFEWLLFDYNNFSLLIDPALWVDYCDALRYDPIMTHCVRNVKPFFIRISLARKIPSTIHKMRQKKDDATR